MKSLITDSATVAEDSRGSGLEFHVFVTHQGPCCEVRCIKPDGPLKILNSFIMLLFQTVVVSCVIIYEKYHIILIFLKCKNIFALKMGIDLQARSFSLNERSMKHWKKFEPDHMLLF